MVSQHVNPRLLLLGGSLEYQKVSNKLASLNNVLQQVVKLVFGCDQAELPINYLGMPLTIKKPTRGDFMPLIEKIERRLQGWQGKFISRGGRLQLINSVIASIPIYHMTCFVLPKWVINRIDLIRRRFLWGKMEGQGRGISLINWELVCTPKHCGGLGAPNLEIRNISLVLRWWWKAQTEPTSLWTTTVIKLKGIAIQEEGPKIWVVNGSFFWNNLIKLLPMFNWSTRWNVGNGVSVSFWYDTWHDAPLRRLKDGQQRPPFQRISLCDAAPLISNLAPDITFSLQLTQSRDELKWMWTKTGKYSAGSFYRVMQIGGTIGWGYKEIWDSPAPSKVRIFTYLLLQGRILTHEVMLRRHMRCELRCVMCNNCDMETAQHLFFSCQYASQVWNRMELHMRFKLMIKEDTVEQTWESSRERCNRNRNIKDWASKFMCVLWFIWRQRNEKIFRDRMIPPRQLADRVVEESALWLQYCGSAAKKEGIG